MFDNRQVLKSLIQIIYIGASFAKRWVLLVSTEEATFTTFLVLALEITNSADLFCIEQMLGLVRDKIVNFRNIHKAMYTISKYICSSI